MRHLSTLLFLIMAAAAQALTIPQGTLYFDNSKTGYSTVRFVYGSDQRAETYVLAMTQDGNKWSVEIPQTVNDMYRFTFVGGNINTGKQEQNFNDFKEYVSHTLSINRTATSEAQMQANDIFVPSSSDNWAQGSWMNINLWQMSQGSQSGTAAISGTLPVVYITTSAAVTDKETYVSGSLYIDALTTGYKNLGSSSAPVAASFKGRGNYTWRDFDKKPYKIKFDAKQEVLGMPKNKHWCLMAGADDCMGFLKNPVGYMLSEAVEMAWSPRTVPVEVVFNGQYWGLYFLTEHVRIAGKRVNITEQEDNATDSVSGGWLVEIDNYQENGNIEFYEGNGQHVMITPKAPEVLSVEQRTYVEAQLLALNDAIYAASSSKLWSMLDLASAAKFYLIQEILEDCESYHGSCYLYKDRDRNGQTAKWHFGPVWDFGNAYNRGQDTWIYVNPIWPQYWIGQIASGTEFQKAVQEQWYLFRHNQQDAVRDRITAFATLIAKAAANDAARWKGTQNYCDNSNMASKVNEFISRYNSRTQWLYSQWGEGIKPSDISSQNEEYGVEFNVEKAEKIIRNGQLYIRVNNTLYDVTGKRVQ